MEKKTYFESNKLRIPLVCIETEFHFFYKLFLYINNKEAIVKIFDLLPTYPIIWYVAVNSIFGLDTWQFLAVSFDIPPHA